MNQLAQLKPVLRQPLLKDTLICTQSEYMVLRTFRECPMDSRTIYEFVPQHDLVAFPCNKTVYETNKFTLAVFGKPQAKCTVIHKRNRNT